MTSAYPEMLTRSSLLPIIVGFSCERSAADPNDPTSLRNAVLRAADPGAATTIAEGMAAGGLNMPPAVLKTASMIPTEPIRAVPIPAHPEATGILLVHREGGQNVEEVIAVSAHGPYVLLQVARSAQGPDQAAARPGSQPAAGVPGMAQSRCVTLDAGRLVPKYWCVAAADRYAFKTVARQLSNAQQRLAA